MFLWPVYHCVTRSSFLLNWQNGYYTSRVKAISKDAWLELKTTELAMVAVIPTCDSMEGIASAPTICYVCDSPNHMACDCSHLTRETERRLSDPPPKKTSSASSVQNQVICCGILQEKDWGGGLQCQSCSLEKCESMCCIC